MQIILRGPAAGYEAEHTARIFFPGAEKAEDLPETEDFVLAESHEMTDLILVRKDGRIYWRTDLRSPEADPEYALCKLEFGLLKDLTGIDPPWGMMTGVRPVRIIHDLRAAGEHDNLDASIDYGSVCHDVDGYLREHTFKLIEAAAEGVAQMLLRRYPLLLGVRVKLDKPWAPVGLPLASCGVEIERVR